MEDFLVEKRFGLDLAIILTDTVEDYLELVLRRLRGGSLDSVVATRAVRKTELDPGMQTGWNEIR